MRQSGRVYSGRVKMAHVQWACTGGHCLGRLMPGIPPRSVRAPAEQRAQFDPRVDVQVRRQVASVADERGAVDDA